MAVTVTAAVTCFVCLTICQANASPAFSSSFAVPIFYDAVKLNELNIKNMPRGVPVKMQLQMLHSVTEFSYYLRPAQLMEFPVITIGANDSQYKSFYRSNCHFDAWRLSEAELSPGFLGVCGGVVEGVIPINSSHVCQIRPTGQVLKSRTGMSESISVHSVQIFPADVGVETVREMTGVYGKMERERGAADVHHPTFWRRLKLLKTRSKRSVREVDMKLEFSEKPYTTDGPFLFKMHFVMDHKFYEKMGSDRAKATKFLTNILGIANYKFRILNLQIVPTGFTCMEHQDSNYVFSDESNTDLFKTVDDLAKYVKKLKNDGTISGEFHCEHLFEGRDKSYGSAVGFAYVHTACSQKSCSAMTMYMGKNEWMMQTTLFLHEVGHNLGGDHVKSCEHEYCVITTVYPDPENKLTRALYSESTLYRFRQHLDSGLQHCMKPSKTKSTKSFTWQVKTGLSAQCGNGIIESGEECDCGGSLVCPNDKCCDADTCRLKSGASCAHGPCCDKSTCQARPARTLCRRQVNECDLPEFCDGSSAECPSDVSKANGAECSGGNFCYDGSCGNVDELCRIVFGYFASAAPGLTCSSKPYKCKALFKDFRSYYMPGDCKWENTVNGYHQLSCDPQIRGLNLPPNGAKCGDEKLCVDDNCKSVSEVFGSQKPNCHGNGWINSKGRCHCYPGYAEPDCKNSGQGGSRDSGPADPNWREASFSSKVPIPNWLVATIVTYTVIVPLIVLISVGIAFACKTPQVEAKIKGLLKRLGGGGGGGGRSKSKPAKASKPEKKAAKKPAKKGGKK